MDLFTQTKHRKSCVKQHRYRNKTPKAGTTFNLLSTNKRNRQVIYTNVSVISPFHIPHDSVLAQWPCLFNLTSAANTLQSLHCKLISCYEIRENIFSFQTRICIFQPTLHFAICFHNFFRFRYFASQFLFCSSLKKIMAAPHPTHLQLWFHIPSVQIEIITKSPFGCKQKTRWVKFRQPLKNRLCNVFHTSYKRFITLLINSNEKIPTLRLMNIGQLSFGIENYCQNSYTYISVLNTIE